MNHYYARKRMSISETRVAHDQTFCSAAVKKGQRNILRRRKKT